MGERGGEGGREGERERGRETETERKTNRQRDGQKRRQRWIERSMNVYTRYDEVSAINILYVIYQTVSQGLTEVWGDSRFR